MPVFQYTAIDSSGVAQRGQVEADEHVSAIQIISSRGLVPVEVNEGKTGSNVPWWQYDVQIFGPRVARKDLVPFFQNFATLIEAQIPLKQVLHFTHDQVSSRPLKAAISTIESEVSNGRPLAISMAAFPDIFPRRVVTVLEIGERSNSLELAAKNAANILETEDTTRREISSALIYPAILMVMAALVMGVVLFHLTPTIAPIFQTAGAEIPWTLRQMMAVRVGILSYWPVIMAAILIPILAVLIFKHKLTALFEPAILRLPFFGPYFRERETHRIAESLSLMLQSGATITQALSAAKDSVNWKIYRNLISKTQEDVEAGGKLSNTLGKSPLIAPMLRNLIYAGEESDRLKQILQTASRSLAKTSNDSLQLAVKLLTPILTLLIGAIVGAMIFSTITAILDLNDIAF